MVRPSTGGQKLVVGVVLAGLLVGLAYGAMAIFRGSLADLPHIPIIAGGLVLGMVLSVVLLGVSHAKAVRRFENRGPGPISDFENDHSRRAARC